MMDATTVYVALLGEGVDVWRPVKAERLEGARFRILPESVVPELEEWEFAPGTIVVCEERQDREGRILVAVRRAP